jgi:hypothetical protein
VSHTSRFSRRRFLRFSALAGGAAVARFPVPAFSQDAASGDKLRVAVIGVARRGAGNLQGVSGENVVALCDADEKRLAIVAAGMLLADDRRTASAWFVAAGVQDDWDRFHDWDGSGGVMCLGKPLGEESRHLLHTERHVQIRKDRRINKCRLSLGESIATFAERKATIRQSLIRRS